MRAELSKECELTIYVSSGVETIALNAWQESGKKIVIEDETQVPAPVQPVQAQLPPGAPPLPPGDQVVTYKGQKRWLSTLTQKELDYYNDPNVMMDRGPTQAALDHHASADSLVVVPAHLKGDGVLGLEKGATEEETTPAPDYANTGEED